MGVSSADIIAFAPEFNTLDAATIDRFIDYAKLSVNSCVWKTKLDFGTILMTCHLLKLRAVAQANSGSGSAGVVTSEKVGDLQRTYGPSSGGGSADSGSLGQSTYGAEFLRLQNSLVITPMVIA